MRRHHRQRPELARERFGFEAEVPLAEGLRRTVDAFVASRVSG